MLNLDDLTVTTVDGRTLLLASDGVGTRPLRAALTAELVLLDVRSVLYAGPATGFTSRPDGSREDLRSAYLRRWFAAEPATDLLPR